jgi:hypothetical protein
MRLPNEYWLRYMIGTNASDAAIYSSSELYGFDDPEVEYLESLRQQVPQPPQENSSSARSWFRRQKVLSLVLGKPDALEARDYLGDGRIRHILEVLILADTERGDIPAYVKDLTGVKVNMGAVRLFEHYFWNRSLLNEEEWKDFVSIRDDREYLAMAYKQGAEYALWKKGYRLEIDHAEMLEVVAHESIMRFLETSELKNDRHTALTAKLWSEVYYGALDGRERTGSAADAVIDKLKQLSLDVDNERVKSVDIIREGKNIISGDVQSKGTH